MKVLEVGEHLPEKLFDEIRRTHLVGMGKSVARRRPHAETGKRGRFQPQPVADIVEADGMGELGKEHGSQMAENIEGASLGLHARFHGPDD